MILMNYIVHSNLAEFRALRNWYAKKCDEMSLQKLAGTTPCRMENSLEREIDRCRLCCDAQSPRWSGMFSTSLTFVFSAFCIVIFVWRVKAAQNHMQG